VPYLLGTETYQQHEGFIAERQRWQRIHALDPKHGLQTIEQKVLHDRHCLALKRRALDAYHQLEDPQLPQELEEVIQQGSLMQAIHAIDHLFAVQAPCHARIIALGCLPTRALRRVLV
jgi:hypothetical protein